MVQMQGTTTVDGNTMYVSPGYTHRVWAYDLEGDKWSRLPDCPQRGAGLAMVSGLLTAVGGRTNDGNATNTLVSLTESYSKWTEHFPPMPMEPDWPAAAVCTGNHLLVIPNNDTKVYVMDTTSLRWFCVSNLPEPLNWAPSLIVCGTELYAADCSTSRSLQLFPTYSTSIFIYSTARDH